MSASSLDHDTVLRAVRQWPRSAQVELAREIMRAVEHEREQQPSSASQSAPQQDSWRQLVGFLATDKPAPSDEEVEQWLEEHRMEKYGR